MPKRLLHLIGSSLLALVLTGCITRFDPDAMQPRAEVEAPPIYETHTVGQTFVAARPNLCAIEVVWQDGGSSVHSFPPLGYQYHPQRFAPQRCRLEAGLLSY